MTVKEIVIKYLKENSYDGLYNENGCGCDIENLVECESECDECIAGYKTPCDCGEGCEFHINREDYDIFEEH